MEDHNDQVPLRKQSRPTFLRMASQSSPDLTKYNASNNVIESISGDANMPPPTFNLQSTNYENAQNKIMDGGEDDIRQRRLSTSENTLNINGDGGRVKSISLLDRLVSGGFVCADLKKASSVEPESKKQPSLLSRFADLGPAANWLVRKPLPDTESEVFRQLAMDKW